MALALHSALMYTLITFSVLPNAFVIIVYIKLRPALQLNDILIISLACSDCLCGMIGYIPEVSIQSEIMSDLEGNSKTCTLTGFTISTLAFVAIAHMIAIPLDRMINIVYPSTSLNLQESYKKWIIVAAVWVYGMTFSILPLVGVSSYTIRYNLCSLDWEDDSFSGKWYLMSLFVFCYLLPIATISISFTIIQKKLKNMQLIAQDSFGDDHISVQRHYKAQKKHVVMISIMISIFFAAWTPYASVSFMIMQDVKISGHLVWISAYLGKCTSVVNPIVYCFTYSKHRSKLKRLFCRSKRVSPAVEPNDPNV